MNLEQIDTSTTAGKAEVMRLAAEGRRVVFKRIKYAKKWRRTHYPEWEWDVKDYAIIRADLAGEKG